MSIKFEEHFIENAVGTGKTRKYVQLKMSKAKSIDELADVIAHNCSVTKSDVFAVMAELSHVAVNELADGNRFYIPEIGYLSLKVGNTPTEQLRNGEITGKDIYLRNVRFQPESKFIMELREKSRFTKSRYTSLSTRFTEDDLWQKVESYLADNGHITCRGMREEFGLSDHFARLWLTRFTEEGKLKKEKLGRQLLYTINQ